jgi:hypothetical protein
MMSFEDINHRSSRRISLTVREDSWYLNLSAFLRQELNFREGDKIRVMQGRGDDTGKILLKKLHRSTHKARVLSSTGRVELGRNFIPPWMKRGNVKARGCELLSVTKGTCVLSVPKDLRLC